MSIIDLDELWAEAHTLHFDAGRYMSNVHSNWVEKMAKMPNGWLLNDNSFFDTMRSHPKKMYVLHVTRDIDKITDSSTLYPSAGCLVGCIYGTQLYPVHDNAFRMHNLGEYILTKEATFAGGEPTPLIIEISYDNAHDVPCWQG